MPRLLPLAATAVASVVAGLPAAARAQDPFEIQVYEYATVPKGMWNLTSRSARAVLNVGYGIGLTRAGNGDVLKMRLGVLFGGR
jgi:hypothetical protein